MRQHPAQFGRCQHLCRVSGHGGLNVGDRTGSTVIHHNSNQISIGCQIHCVPTGPAPDKENRLGGRSLRAESRLTALQQSSQSETGKVVARAARSEEVACRSQGMTKVPAPRLITDTSISGAKVTRELDALVRILQADAYGGYDNLYDAAIRRAGAQRAVLVA